MPEGAGFFGGMLPTDGVLLVYFSAALGKAGHSVGEFRHDQPDLDGLISAGCEAAALAQSPVFFDDGFIEPTFGVSFLDLWGNSDDVAALETCCRLLPFLIL